MPAQDKKAELLDWLQTAIELELATIPPYYVALLSIKLPSNREAAELIRSVMIEEMLHLALVANVLNAVGGNPRLNANTIPEYPLEMKFEGGPFLDRKFPIDLAPFSAESIETFMKIEEPQQLAPKVALRAAEISIHGLTIGQFYDTIIARLEELEDATPGKLFVGDPLRQIREDYYWSGGGGIVAVSDLSSAKAALNVVISQGEGAWPPAPGTALTGFGKPMQMGHFYRFSEIHYAKHYDPADNPSLAPTGAPLLVDYTAVFPIKVNAKSKDYAPGSKLATLNDAFNSRYTAMMTQLEEALNGTPKSLYTAIMNGMHGLTPIAHEMMEIVIPDDSGRHTGCPTFEWA